MKVFKEFPPLVLLLWYCSFCNLTANSVPVAHKQKFNVSLQDFCNDVNDDDEFNQTDVDFCRKLPPFVNLCDTENHAEALRLFAQDIPEDKADLNRGVFGKYHGNHLCNDTNTCVNYIEGASMVLQSTEALSILNSIFFVIPALAPINSYTYINPLNGDNFTVHGFFTPENFLAPIITDPVTHAKMGIVECLPFPKWLNTIGVKPSQIWKVSKGPLSIPYETHNQDYWAAPTLVSYEAPLVSPNHSVFVQVFRRIYAISQNTMHMDPYWDFVLGAGKRVR